MSISLPTRWLLAVALIAVFAAPALSQTTPAIDYLGYAWETGGFPPSDVGDVLVFTGVGVSADPIFGVDLGVDELTFYMYDLVSTGQVDMGGGSFVVNYSGGYLEIYRDGAQNADWGFYPPNATSPATFVDGSLFFQGSFNYFTLYLTAAGNGAYEGTLDGLAGEVLSEVCQNCAYTWGGNFTQDAGAQIPDGYDIQMDGVFELDGAVADEASTWGDVKALFGN